MNKDKAATRSIRFLAKGTATIRGAANGKRVLLDGADRGVIGVASEVLDDLARRGVVVIDGTQLRLTPLGASAARRETAPADAFRVQHQEHEAVVMETVDGRETVTVNAAESPLGLLRRYRTKQGSPFLSLREFDAGERLRSDYSRGQIMPHMGVNWGAVSATGRSPDDRNGIADLTDAALSARLRVEHAIDAVGPELSGVLIDVCCFLKGLERVETERHWPARSAKLILKSALGVLARHYEPSRKTTRRPDAILHWGTADYRPSLG